MPRERINGDEVHAVVQWGIDTTVNIGVDIDPRVIGESGLYTTLNRDECNKLIKVIRRARNAAYGGDE